MSAARQRRALAAIVGALTPAELAVPDTVRTLLAPGAEQVTPTVELFGGRARPAFDELGAARTLASMIADAALQSDRATRLVQQHLHDPRQPSLGEVIDALVGAQTAVAADSPRDAALRRVAQRAVVDRLLALAADTTASAEVRAMAELKLGEVGTGARRTLARHVGDVDARAYLSAVAADVERWQTRREAPRPTRARVAPPGDPFGEEP